MINITHINDSHEINKTEARLYKRGIIRIQGYEQVSLRDSVERRARRLFSSSVSFKV